MLLYAQRRSQSDPLIFVNVRAPYGDLSDEREKLRGIVIAIWDGGGGSSDRSESEQASRGSESRSIELLLTSNPRSEALLFFGIQEQRRPRPLLCELASLVSLENFLETLTRNRDRFVFLFLSTIVKFLIIPSDE